MDEIIYTIGYSTYGIEDFIKELKKIDKLCLIDVRSCPYSEHFNDYSINNLEPILKENNIIYRNYKDEFGARQDDNKYYRSYGYLDFEEFIKSKVFQAGVEKIVKGKELGYNFVLMCAEKDPIMCHRAIMVGRGLSLAGFQIHHIVKDNDIQTQEDIENRLLNIYFPNRTQLNLFEQKTQDEYISDSYRLQNEKIGYKKEKVA